MRSGKYLNSSVLSYAFLSFFLFFNLRSIVLPLGTDRPGKLAFPLPFVIRSLAQYTPFGVVILF